MSLHRTRNLFGIALLLAAAHSLAQTAPPPPSAPTATIAGDWQGTLIVGSAQLHLLFHIASTPEGALSATFDSVDQHADGLPIAATTFKDNILSLTIPVVHGSYTGTLSKDASTITGNWTQGQSLPLDLHRSATPIAALEPKRPQNPTKPYPYRSIDLTYTNPLQHDVLAATLTLPPGQGPFPAVLLITGSGPQDRDESLMGHNPFLVLSDYLTRHGIAVLRADDRGTAHSTGDFASATTADFATDALAGLALLHSRPEIDPHRIGLLGHSEGGLIAPMIAAGMVPALQQSGQAAPRNAGVAFIVLMAGPGLPGLDILTEQARLLTLAAGAPPADADTTATKQRKLLTLAISSPSPSAAIRSALAAEGLPPAQIDASLQQVTSPWVQYFLRYDPAPALRKLTCPVLALDGSKDLQVAPRQNLAAIRAALTAGGNTHFEIVEFPNLNHLFQTATTGSPNEYAAIEETIAPVVLEKIFTWILKQ